VETARSLAPVVIGNVRTEEISIKAGIDGTQAVIAATDNDISNLSTSLGARRIHPEVHTVIRIFDAVQADKICRGRSSNAVLSASSAAWPTFVGCKTEPRRTGSLQEMPYP
jgi:voltage-gated potassium channel